MAVNRYTKLSTPRYNPRSMEEMMMLPMMQRKQHNASLEKAAEMGIFEQQAANVDKEVVDRVKGEYEDGINEYVEKLNKEGFNNETTEGLLELAKRRREVEEKYLNPAQANLQAMQKLKKDLMESKDWSPAMAQAYAERQISNFGGTFNEDGSTNSFNGRMLPKHVDVNKRLDEAIDNIGTDIVQGGLEQYGIHGFYDLMQSTKIESKDKNKILASVGAQLQGDSEFLNSYRVESQLNGQDEFDSKGNLKIGNFDEQGNFLPQSNLGVMLHGKAMGASETKQTLGLKELKDDLRVDAAKRNLEEAKNGDVPYAMLADKQFEVSTQGTLSNIGRIGTEVDVPQPMPPRSDSEEAMASYLKEYKAWKKRKEAGDNLYTIDMMPAKDREQYTTILDKLKTTGRVSANLDPNSEEAAKEVNEYLSKYQTASYSNALIQPNAVSPESTEGALMLAPVNGRAEDFLEDNIKAGITKVWDENGNPVEFEQEDWEEGGDIAYLGYVSPNNYIDQLGTSGPAQSVMPHMFLGPDGNKYYAARQDSETKKPTFKAGHLIKSATFNGAREPELPVSHVVDPLLQKIGIEDVTTRYNPNTKTYNLEITRNGELYYSDEGKGLSTKQFNEAIYRLFK